MIIYNRHMFNNHKVLLFLRGVKFQLKCLANVMKLLKVKSLIWHQPLWSLKCNLSYLLCTAPWLNSTSTLHKNETVHGVMGWSPMVLSLTDQKRKGSLMFSQCSLTCSDFSVYIFFSPLKVVWHSDDL